MGLEHIAAGYGIGMADLYLLGKSNGNGRSNGKGNGKAAVEIFKKRGVVIARKKEKPELAVVIVDMQEDFLKLIPPEKMGVMIKNQINVIKYCAGESIPVVALEACGYRITIAELNCYFSQLQIKTFGKRENDGFTNSGFLGYLRELKVKRLFFMGVNAGACVVDTAAGGLNSGFGVVTAEGVIAQPEHWDAILYRKLFGEKGRLYLDGGSYLEKGREVRIEAGNGDLVDRLVNYALNPSTKFI